MDMYYCTDDEKTIYCNSCGKKLTEKRTLIYDFETGNKNNWVTKECNNIKCSMYKSGLKSELSLLGMLIIVLLICGALSSYIH